jgi:hypothetical protein
MLTPFQHLCLNFAHFPGNSVLRAEGGGFQPLSVPGGGHAKRRAVLYRGVAHLSRIGPRVARLLSAVDIGARNLCYVSGGATRAGATRQIETERWP